MAAHLGIGVVAAHTTKPVIGIPIPSGSLSGFDSLLSTVQMPPGIPVATVAVGSSGAKNAAIFWLSKFWQQMMMLLHQNFMSLNLKCVKKLFQKIKNLTIKF